MSHPDCSGLTVDAWSSKPDLSSAVIAHTVASYDRRDRISGGNRVFKAFKYHDADAIAEDRAARIDIECPTMAVRRHHTSALVQVAPFLRKRNRNAARKHHIGLFEHQRLRGVGDGEQRRRARGLHRERRTAEIKLIGNTRSEKIVAATE